MMTSHCKSILRYVLIVLLALLSNVSDTWADEYSTRTMESLPQQPGYTLQPGRMYVVRNSMTLTASAAQSALVVAPKGSGQAPVLYIPDGITLTVTGGNAVGRQGAGAGIYVPSAAELIVTGGGTLVATGGNAAGGADGENGGNPNGYTGVVPKDLARWKADLKQSGNLEYSGTGGAGGDGGGGAGAGIGGIGGNGGAGGTGGATKYYTVGGKNSTKDGGDGGNGGAGGAGVAMGKVYVTGGVTITAHAGQASGVAGQGGDQGYSFTEDIMLQLLLEGSRTAGAGGGGGGGGAGYAAPCGIGAGGRGGGGGGGGGSGAIDQGFKLLDLDLADLVKYTNSSCRAASGLGGVGNVNGADGLQSRGNQDNGTTIGLLEVSYFKVGGNAGSSGAAGVESTAADYGSLYVKSSASVTGHDEYQGTTSTAPTDLKIQLQFKNREYNADGSSVVDEVSIGTLDATIGEAFPVAAASPYVLTATGKVFTGYYSALKGGGECVYQYTDSNLSPSLTRVAYSRSLPIYAHFMEDGYKVIWDYSYENGGTEDSHTLAEVVPGDRIKFARLVIRYNDKKQEALTLNATAATPQTESSGSLNGHLVINGVVSLSQGVPTETTIACGSEGNFSVLLPAAKLAKVASVEFLPMQDASTPAANWIGLTDAETGTTVFSYIGAMADGKFPLNWQVTLSGLDLYPESIFVQPMRRKGAEAYVVNPATANTSGIECALDATQANTGLGDGSSRTYSGTFPVWKADGDDAEYDYRIGITGFVAEGDRLFFGSNTTPGDSYLSSEGGKVTWAIYNGEHARRVTLTLDKSNLPILHLDPNGGALTAETPTLVMATDGTISAPNDNFFAVRDGLVFRGWADVPDAKRASITYDTNLTSFTAWRTIYAVWGDAVFPVVEQTDVAYTLEGAVFTFSVTDNGAVQTAYVISDTPIDDLDAYSGEWQNSPSAARDSRLHDIVVTDKSYSYIYIRAMDDYDNVTYLDLGRQKIDQFAPTFAVSAEGILCGESCEIIVRDNIAISSVELKNGDGEWTAVSAFTSATDKEKTFTIPVPTTAEAEVYSLRVTDGADNVTEYGPFVTMYKDHDWSMPHTVMVKEGDIFLQKHYCECGHSCGLIKVEDTPLSDSNEAEAFLASISRAVIMKGGNVLAHYFCLNDAIARVTEPDCSIVLIGDVNVGATDVTAMATPTQSLTLDLNGYGLRVNGSASEDVTGNASVTLLLKDDGVTPYTNCSKVTESPISYQRSLFSPFQQNSWQALFLPFNATFLESQNEGTRIEFCEIGSVQINGKTEAHLTLTPHVSTNFDAFLPYFVCSSSHFVLSASDNVLLPYSEDVVTKCEIKGQSNYQIAGSLTNTNHVATGGKTFWVLTNSGEFWFAAQGAHQRPYRWVIYDESASPSAPRSLTFSIGDEQSAIAAPTDSACSSARVYTVAGVRMNGAVGHSEGLYIRDGKVVYDTRYQHR